MGKDKNSWDRQLDTLVPQTMQSKRSEVAIKAYGCRNDVRRMNPEQDRGLCLSSKLGPNINMMIIFDKITGNAGFVVVLIISNPTRKGSNYEKLCV